MEELYRIEVVPPSHPEYGSYARVLVNGLHIGSGPLQECNALAEELRESDKKAAVVFRAIRNLKRTREEK